jgi:hypothetical protein
MSRDEQRCLEPNIIKEKRKEESSTVQGKAGQS